MPNEDTNFPEHFPEVRHVVVDGVTPAIDVKLHGAITRTIDQPLWVAIRASASSLAFKPYKEFIEKVFCHLEQSIDPLKLTRVATAGFGVEAYRLLRAATEAFVLLNVGALVLEGPADSAQAKRAAKLIPDESFHQQEENSRFGGSAPDIGEIRSRLAEYLGTGVLPYLDRIVAAFGTTVDYKPLCEETPISLKVLSPLFLELIWSYWEEEAMLVQSMNAIAMRFQNKRGTGDRDPLVNLATNPLRPLSNLLWGYVEDDDHRLTVARRAYEYEQQYGLPLARSGVKLRPAERRSDFLKAFHSLLHAASVFYDKASNLTVRADGFALLTALREVHLLLAEGANNQYRDLPSTARTEMLMMQWLLSRTEIREFLGARASIPYTEPWMGAVDSVKRLMGWSDTSVTYFHDLATDGEMILLSVRFGDWSRVNDDEQARSWAQYWRPEIQRYIHAYQTVTGIDLSAVSADRQAGVQINATPPSVLLEERLARQRAAKG